MILTVFLKTFIRKWNKLEIPFEKIIFVYPYTISPILHIKIYLLSGLSRIAIRRRIRVFHVTRRFNIEREKVSFKPVNWDSFHNEGLGSPTLVNEPICFSNSVSETKKERTFMSQR